MGEQFGRVAIVGLGLKGGSLAMVLRKKRIAKEVVGIDTNQTILTKAVHRNIVDQAVAELAEGLPQADLVVIAVPTQFAPEVLASVAPHLQVGTVVCDVGRLKGPVLEKAGEILPEENPFVGCHLWFTWRIKISIRPFLLSSKNDRAYSLWADDEMRKLSNRSGRCGRWQGARSRKWTRRFMTGFFPY
jgi:hypothetical protein